MIRRTAVTIWLMLLTANPVLGHEGHVEEPDPAFWWGAWGLIAMGVLFFLITVMPYRAPEDGGGLPLLRGLQARMETETTGWRRWQWPLIGLFFVGLGSAMLLGWM